MFIVDTALKKRAAADNPIRVGMVGVGFIGRGCVNQIINQVPGMDLVAMANRTPARAADALAVAGRPGALEADSQGALDDSIRAGQPVVTSDPMLLCASDQIDVILELTGAITFGAEVALAAFAHGKHFVSMNAELDATAGPIMRKKANEAGVIYTISDGDQPGVQMNLYRFVETMGLQPLVCGNIKGMLDLYRTPETQRGFAAQWGQTPEMVTSFADGTKIAFEQAIVANATGMCVAERGMSGPEHKGQIDGLVDFYDVDKLKALGGVVDYALGSTPSPGVYVFAAQDDERHHIYLDYAKLGKGPLYSFYIPYHLYHFEVPISIARAVDFNDTVLATEGPIRVEVAATAKRDLKVGEVIDGLGGFMTYGECENAWICADENLLPMGIAEGCKLIRDVPKDQAIRYGDVEVPDGRLIDALRVEQDAAFAPAVP
ncbi:MAG: NAD(P)-dependent oxidoreductase [Pseudomonadota bacterium]